MNELISLEEITTEAVTVWNRMGRDYNYFGELIAKAKKLVPSKEWESYLTVHFPGIGKRQAYRYMELARDKTHTKTLSNITNVSKPVSYKTHISAAETSPKVREFVRKTEEFKREQDSLFSTKVRFMLDSVNDCLIRDNPWRGLYELLKLNTTQLSQTDLSLAIELARAIGQLEVRAGEWYDKIIGKFDVEREDGSDSNQHSIPDLRQI